MHAKGALALTLAFLFCIASGCSTPQQEISDLQAIFAGGNRPHFISNDEHSQKLWDITTQLYTQRGFRPAWSTNGRINTNADAALLTLENAPQEGLNPEEFGLSTLRAQRSTIEASRDLHARSQFDVQLTHSLVGYVSRLCFGRIDPRKVDASWPAPKATCNVPQIVSAAIEGNGAAALAEQLAPKLQEYQGLKTALKRYRVAAAQGGWQSLPAGAGKKGAMLTHAPLLASTLVRMGDLDASNEEEAFSDEILKAALKRFQSRHGLDPTGDLNEKTVRALNVPVEQRIEQIEINFDRMRWAAAGFEPHHLRVNVADFQLSIHDGANIPLRMRVIVGSDENRTPLLDSQIEYLVFSPYWNIPFSIATKEMLPKVRKDPDYFAKEEIEVLQSTGGKVKVINAEKIDWEGISEENLKFQLRQKPGAANALGLVKFIFPNPFDIYLHDTPTDSLFGRLTRTLSHGCVRLEQPAELAAYVLQDQPEWTSERIETAMGEGKETRVSLKTPLPIHVLYWTAWAEADGQAQFREDVYGYDSKHRELVARR